MRYPDGTLVGDLGDQYSTQTSSSLAVLSSSLDFNENQTQYDLLPVIVNRPPVVVGNIVDVSSQPIKPIQLTDGFGRELYINNDGVIRVCVNTSFTLRFIGQQPDTFNIENGVPVIMPDSANLIYVWRYNENPLYSFNLDSLNSRIEVSQNTLTFTNIQSIHAGVYSCEVSNDIGTTSSETLTIEVYEPDIDPMMYTNLVQNGSAQDGTSEWNANNTDFVTKDGTKIPTDKLKTPNRVDLFGYTIDTMYPRPYQIETGVLRGYDYNSILTTNLRYFSRTPYKYLNRGGTSYVKAYQDIDLSSVTDIIRGGVYGINGVTGIFSCYIGNALSNYRPVREIAARDKRLTRREYFFGAPRLSVENFLSAGPGYLLDRAFVTLEEYQDETRLSSRILTPDGQSVETDQVLSVSDPWNKRIVSLNNPDASYYTNDIFQLGIERTQGNEIDRYLRVADQLFSNYDERFTYGQYIEFNKLIIDKLNPNTNKVRVTIHFVCDDARLEETWRKITEFGSGDCYDFTSWDSVYKKASFDYFTLGNGSAQSIWNYINNSPNLSDEAGGPGLGLQSEDLDRKFFFQPDPRPLVTGVGFALLPVLRDDLESFVQYRTQALSLNSTPTASVVSVLRDLTFDPLERNRRNLFVTFKHRSTFTTNPNATTVSPIERMRANTPRLTYQNTTRIGLAYQNAGSTSLESFTRLDMERTGLFPFSFGQEIDTSIATDATASFAFNKFRYLTSRTGEVVDQTTTSLLSTLVPVTYNRRLEAINALPREQYFGAIGLPPSIGGISLQSQYQGTPFDEEGTFSVPQVWYNKSRFICYYNVRSTSDLIGITNASSISNNLLEQTIQNSNGSALFNAYYVDIDFSSTASGVVTLSRDGSLPGYGLLQPVEVEHGFTPEEPSLDFYFKLPDNILYAPFASGGLGIPSGSAEHATSLFLVQVAPYGENTIDSPNQLELTNQIQTALDRFNQQISGSTGAISQLTQSVVTTQTVSGRTNINGIAIPPIVFGGTPIFGYDPNNTNYYYISYQGIYDQIMDGNEIRD